MGASHPVTDKWEPFQDQFSDSAPEGASHIPEDFCHIPEVPPNRGRGHPLAGRTGGAARRMIGSLQ